MVNSQVRYVCLTDRPIRPNPYKQIRVETPTEGERAAELYARQIKILADHRALGSPDVVLWHDAAFRMDADPVAIVEQHLTDGVDMVAFKHPHRSRIEDEGEVIARFGYAPPETVREQVATYRADGFPEQSVITSTGFSIRRMTDAVKAFNRLWWEQVQRWTWRDQMSVDYAIWKTGLKVAYLPGHYRDNRFARWFPS